MQNDLTPSEVHKWVDIFLKAGEQGLKVRCAGSIEQADCRLQLLEEGIRASLRQICAVLGIHRSNIYYVPKPRAKARAAHDPWLVGEIRKVIENYPGSTNTTRSACTWPWAMRHWRRTNTN